MFNDASKIVWVAEKLVDKDFSSDFSSVDEFYTDKLNVGRMRVYHDQTSEFSDLEREVDNDQPKYMSHQDVSCAVEGKYVFCRKLGYNL